MDDAFFRKLTDTEAAEFRAWAHEHYVAGTPINPVWHPVVRAECERINASLPPE